MGQQPRKAHSYTHGNVDAVSGALTQVKMEKKQKVMAARAASPPSFSGLSSGLDICHWFAKKQKPTNHMKDQNAGGKVQGRC